MFVGQDRPIAIRALKRFACDQFGPEARSTSEVLESIKDFIPPVAADAEEMAALIQSGTNKSIEKGDGKTVAIIGAGPAGLSAAHDLALMGFRPVVFEIEPVAAGMLAVGVPAYRMPRELIEKEVAVIEALGVEIRCGVIVGEDITFAELRKDFAAVIIAVGAKSSRGLGLTGESGTGVIRGVDLLRAVSLGEDLEMGRESVVIGGGYVAYDVARSVVRQIGILVFSKVSCSIKSGIFSSGGFQNFIGFKLAHGFGSKSFVLNLLRFHSNRLQDFQLKFWQARGFILWLSSLSRHKVRFSWLALFLVKSGF